MSSVDRYRRYALECLRLAQDAKGRESKTAMLDMAHAWVRLANQAEKNSRTDLVYETPSPRPRPAS